MIASITYEDVNALYDKLRIPFEESQDKPYDESFFSNQSGESVSTDKTMPYAEFVDVISVTQH